MESSEQVCQQLLDLALERGGSDNITLVVGRARKVARRSEVWRAGTGSRSGHRRGCRRLSTGARVQGQAAGRYRARSAPPSAGSRRRSISGTREALALLERVVNINSGTMNFEGVRKVGDAFKAELDALGFSTKWVDGAGFKRAGHLVAERNGRGPAHPADRAPRHRLRAEQSVPEVRAARPTRRRAAPASST